MDGEEKKIKEQKLIEAEMNVRTLRKELNLKSGSGRGTFIIAIIALLAALGALIPDLISKEEIPTDIVTSGELVVVKKALDALEERIKEIEEMEAGTGTGVVDRTTKRRLAALEAKNRKMERKWKWHSDYIAKLMALKTLAKLEKLGTSPPPDDDDVTPPPDDGKPGQEVTLKVEASETMARIFFNRTWNDEGYRSGSNPVFEGVPPSTYRVNTESEAGLWAADAASLSEGKPHFEVRVNGTVLKKIEDNGVGGANFVFTVNSDGSISQ